ncbi:hypothetical protein N7532_004119 [Penicillium argentinense]|uniref:PH domain-containing protein n=1 Tax=Penicillium argentinense TaxID=1131581 RepID=A0A9W9KEI1_9EURO|nr:uncharacterized protein N7532_004119 [Penicillium argentinense]KAJ5103590.1 hypothetical protein N7532_004119 [Penicillium argentinense]
MDLRKTASEAEDVAAGFRLFRFPLPEHEADITDLIVEFYGISSSMQKLYSLSHDPRYSRNWPLVERDAFLVQSSLKYTLSDIHDFFGRLDPDRSRADKFREVWRTIELFFWEESKSSLRIRLAKYRVFLIELADVLLSKLQELSLHQAHRDGIKLLLATQERQRIPDHFGRMSLSRNPSSAGSASASASGNSTEPSSPVSDRRLRRGSGFNIPPPPPLAPEAPSSPLTGSASATTSTSQSSRSDTIRDHWIHDVLSRDEPETPFQSEGRQVVGCSGKPNPGIKRELQEMGFVLLTRMHLSAQMRVYFYLRESDNRIRIVIRVPRDGEKEYYCLPLNLLEVIRQGPVLRLCRRRDSGSELHEWASLYFTTIESMTAFFCSFLALRAQDRYKPVSSIRDWEMEGEEEIFAGEIIEGVISAASVSSRTKIPKRFDSSHQFTGEIAIDADDFLDTMDEVIDEYTRSVRYV